MQVHFEKSGDQLIISIPDHVAAASQIQPGSLADLTLENGKIVIALAPEPTYTLDGLLAGVTEENKHGEISTGPAVGKEVW